MRKMASVQQIAEVKSIPGADRICAYRINGWWVVDRVSQYGVGDSVVYLEPDSWVPVELAPFLCGSDTPKLFEGIAGAKLRTVRLKKQLSQGLILPLSSLGSNVVAIGDDVSEILGVKKWEAPEPAQLSGHTKGSFPSFLWKTDQERCQNLVSEIESWKGLEFEVTEKMEGSSATFFLYNGEFGVCSRNLELKEDETNSFWFVARKYKIEEALRRTGKNIAIQGELVGPGVQGNVYGLTFLELFVFDMFNIDEQAYFTPENRIAFCERFKLQHSPVIEEKFQLDHNVDQLLQLAEGESKVAKTAREGLVFKCLNNPSIHFKAVSNSYLLKH